MPNRFVPIPADTTPAQQVSMLNKNFAELDAETYTKIYKDANGVPVISIGMQSDGNNRILVAKAGIDVTTATAAQLAFNSDQNVFKIVATDTVTFTRTASTTVYAHNIAHGLSYIPIPLVFQADSGVYQQLPIDRYELSGASSGKLRQNIHAYVDATNLAIVFNVPDTSSDYASPLTYTFRYYLLQETAN